MDFFKNEKIPISQINLNQILNKNLGDRENLLNELKKISGKKGLATLCIGGGMGISMCIEKD